MLHGLRLAAKKLGVPAPPKGANGKQHSPVAMAIPLVYWYRHCYDCVAIAIAMFAGIAIAIARGSKEHLLAHRSQTPLGRVLLLCPLP